MKAFWILLLAMLIAIPAFADPVRVSPHNIEGCVEWTLCDAVASNGTCGGSGNENFLRPPAAAYTYTAEAFESTDTSGSWTITMYETGRGMEYDGTRRTAINGTALSKTQWTAKWEYLTGDIHAVIASYASGTLTLKIRACPIVGG